MEKGLDNMPNLKFIAEKEKELKSIAQSPDGEKLKQMVSPDIIKAAQNGDSEAVRQFVSSILSTKEGARLAQRLAQLGKQDESSR